MPPRLHPALPATMAAVLAGLFAPSSPSPLAAPQVEIRARTVVQLKPIIRTRAGLLLSGRLTDRASPEPIGNAPIIINIDDEIYTVVSDQDGSFELKIPVEIGVYDIRVSFPGDRYLDPSAQSLERFDVENEPLELTVSANPTGDRFEIVVRAQSAGRPVDVGVVLWGGDVTAAELTRLAEPSTDANGRASQVLSRDQLGGFGNKRIEVRFTGDDTYDAATASTAFSIHAKTTTTLRVADSQLAFEDTLRGTGVATDEDGAPLPDQRVVLEAAGRELAEATTDKSGAFSLEVEASELGEGALSVQAVLYPRARYLASSRSKPVALSVAEKKPVPIAATLAAFGATCAALLAFVAFRTKPWTRWLERLSRREPAAPRPASEASERRAPGLAPARPGLVSTLRRPSDFGFTGHVYDVVTGRAVGAATIGVLTGEANLPTHKVTADADGAFSIESLPVGEWKVVATARGYMPETFKIEVPHRGELRSAHIDLLAIREYIFDLYGELARPLLPGPDRWGVWTPRQIFEHVRSQRRAAGLRELTAEVEELYFSQRTPELTAVDEAREQIAAVAAEIARAS